MSNIMKLGFDPLEGIFVEETEGMIVNKKFINPEDLRSLLVRGVQIQTPVLPTGCKYYAEGDGKKYVVLEYQNNKRKIMYHSRGDDMIEKIIPLPYTIFGFAIEGSVISLSLCLTSATPIANDSTQLYRFPFGNVYGDLRICWGNTRLPSVRDVVQLSGIPNLFYTAPFNGDLVNDNSFQSTSTRRWTELIESIEDQEFFPPNELVEAMTFGEFKERLCNYRG